MSHEHTPLDELTQGKAPPPEKFMFPIVCGECATWGAIPFAPPDGKRWKGPRNWFDLIGPSLNTIGWYLSASEGQDADGKTAMWFACPLCPKCAAKVVDVDEDELGALTSDS